jgi:hypothetical protein
MALDMKGLFVNPAQIRAKRMEDLMQQRRQLAQMGGSMSGLLGQVAGGGSVLGQQLAEGIGRGLGLKTQEEAMAEQQMQQAKAVMSGDMTKLVDLREKLMADPNANPAMISAIDQRLGKLQEKSAAAARARSAGAMIRNQFGNEAVAQAVESGAFELSDAVTMLNKDPKLTVVGNTAIDAEGNVVFNAKPTTYTVLSPSEVADTGAPPGTVLKKNNKTGEVEKVVGPAARTANYGAPPKDHQWVEEMNADGTVSVRAEVIPNTPTARKLEKEGDKEKLTMSGWHRRHDFMDMKLTEAIDFIEKNPEAAAGFTAKLYEDVSKIPFIGALVAATDPIDFQNKLETLRSNVGFDRLQRMREESPTGGALGQVAVMELIALQASLGSLNVGQSPEELKKNLIGIRDSYRKVSVEYAKHFSAEELHEFGFGNLAVMKESIESGELTEEDIISGQGSEPKEDSNSTTVNWNDLR